MARTILRAGRIAAAALIAIAVTAAILIYSAGPGAPGAPGHAEAASLIPQVVATVQSGVVSAPAYTQEQLKLLAIVHEKPGTYDALMALKKLATLHLEGDRFSLASDSLAQLVSPFADSRHLPGNLHDIVRTAVQAGKYEAVYQMCDSLALQPAQSQGVVWLRMAQALAALYSDDDPTLTAATENLLLRHGTDLRCVEAFGQIAYAFRQLKKYDRSRQYYQYVVDNWPHAPRAVFSLRGLVWTNQMLNDQPAAIAALNTLLTEYKDDPDIMECIRPLADSFEQKDDYDTALRIHRYIADNRTKDGAAIWSQFKVFQIALVKLDDEDLAWSAYQQIWDRFSGHDRIAQVICEAAWECRKLKRHQEALQMYRAAQVAQPKNDRAIIAQRGIVSCLLALKDTAGAIAESYNLLTTFANDKQLPLIAIEVGDALGWADFYYDAIALYSHIVRHHSQDSRAVAAQRRIVTAYIKLNDDQAAQQSFDDLLAGFADDPRLGSELYAVAESYRARKSHAAAASVYTRVIANYPQTNDAMWASQRLIRMPIDESPDTDIGEVPPNLLAAIDNLIADYTHVPELARAVFYLGEEYWKRIRESKQHLRGNKDCYAAAITIWRRILDDVPFQQRYTPFACYMCAYCYEETGHYDEAIAFYKMLTEVEFRAAEYSHRAPLALAEIYAFRKNDFETAAHWYTQQNIIFDHALGLGHQITGDRAMFGLGVLYRNYLRDYARAIEVYEEYMHKFPRGERVRLAPLNIARCHAALGDTAKAINIINSELEVHPENAWADAYNRVLDSLQEGAAQ